MLPTKKISNKSNYCFALLLSLILTTVIAGCKSKESYRKELERKGIPYSVESFLGRVGVGNKETIELFFKSGMNVNAKGINGETALMQAAVNHDIEMIKLLIDKGADVNTKNNDGYTALMFVSSNGDLEVLKLLIDKGADVNAKNNDGETALMLASLNDELEVVKMFIKKGADINVKSNKGDTALTYAFLNTQIEELLRNAGAKE
jgi:ankyrin repeat protein